MYKHLILNSILFSLLVSSCSGDGEEETVKINLKEELDVEKDTFLISPNSDTLIFGKSGTAIFFPAGSFYPEGDDTTAPVKIVLKEYYDMSDILMQDLSTESNGELLETGGMINIKAYSEGSEVNLKYGKEFIVHFPKNGSKADDMQLFSQGFYDSAPGDNAIRWEEEPRSEGYEIDSLMYWYTKWDGIDSPFINLKEDGTYLLDWLHESLEYTEEERDYIRFRDVNIHYTLTTQGILENIRYEKEYDESRVRRFMEIVKGIPLVEPFTINGVPKDNDGWIHFYMGNVPSKLTDAKYLKSFEKKYPDFEKKSINDLDQAELHYFIFSSAKLGWLNVDRFVDDPAPKVDMTLTLDDPEDLMVKMIYKDFKSVIPPLFANGVHSFSGIPEGKNITLMIIRNSNDKLMMSITEHVTANGEITGMKFKEYTLGELKAELKKLD